MVMIFPNGKKDIQRTDEDTPSVFAITRVVSLARSARALSGQLSVARRLSFI
jgi:hypothetical protein